MWKPVNVRYYTRAPPLHLFFLFPKGRTHRKQIERLSKTTENCQIHSQLIQYISIYVLFHLLSLVLHVRIVATINSDRTNCWADCGCEANHSFCLCHRTAVGGQGGLPYLLNFTFSIRYFLRVHKGVEYPLQKKIRKDALETFCPKSHSNAVSKGAREEICVRDGPLHLEVSNARSTYGESNSPVPASGSAWSICSHVWRQKI